MEEKTATNESMKLILCDICMKLIMPALENIVIGLALLATYLFPIPS
jgi:hypothetical protein